MGYHFLVLSTIFGMGAVAIFMMLVVLRHLRWQRCNPKQYLSTFFLVLGRYEQSITICMLILFEVAMFAILLSLVLGWLGGMGYIHLALENMDSANRFERNMTILHSLVGYAPVVAIPSACCLILLVSIFKRREEKANSGEIKN